MGYEQVVRFQFPQSPTVKQACGGAGSLECEDASLPGGGNAGGEELPDGCCAEILQKLPAAVVVLDCSGRVRFHNPHAEELLGQPLQGEFWRDIVTRVVRPRLDDGHDMSLWNGHRVAITTQSLTSSPGQLLLLNDVTRARDLQDRVGRQVRLAELGEMMAGLAHQIRTPLSAALLYAPHAAREDVGIEVRRGFAERTVESLQHVERLTKDMLTFARAGSFACEPIDMVALVRRAEYLFADLLQKKCASVVLRLPPGPITVFGNEDALVTVLQNLVMNALEAHEGEACIEIEVRDDGAVCELELTDNGPGIPVRIRDRIFEPFISGRKHGTGLGLAVVRSVVQAHRGSVRARNGARGGARFGITIPIHTSCPEGMNPERARAVA